MIKFRGTYPGEDGLFFINSIEYLAGNTFGWNEFTLDTIGTGNFSLNDGILIIEDIEFVQISKGRIHRYDTRIIGDEALSALRNRYERIYALTDWMIAAKSESEMTQRQSIKDFEKRPRNRDCN